MLTIKNIFNLPSGHIYLYDLDGYLIESTEMQDVATKGKEHIEVRETLDPRIIWKHLVPKEEKWLMTVSTQKGCVHNCKFCDVAPLPFKGNLSINEILDQVEFMLSNSIFYKSGQYCNKGKIGFARMGEPSHNTAVLVAMERLNEFKNINWLRCFNTIIPRKTLEGYSGKEYLEFVLDAKEKNYNGYMHVQISCNSTNEEQRKYLFGNSDVLTIEEVIKIVNKHNITNRTITLNFIVMEGIEIDINYLMKLGLNNSKFTVKLIPLNKTFNSENNNLKTYANYSTYEKLQDLSNEFKNNGIPVVMDSIARCEEAGLCCGQLAQIFS